MEKTVEFLGNVNRQAWYIRVWQAARQPAKCSALWKIRKIWRAVTSRPIHWSV